MAQDTKKNEPKGAHWNDSGYLKLYQLCRTPRQARRVLALVLLAAASARVVSAQSPHAGAEFAKGSVTGGVYVNRSLGISWEIPQNGIIGQTPASLLGGNYNVLLRVLTSGTQAGESIELDYSPEADGRDEAAALAAGGWHDLSGRTGYYTLGGGIPAYRHDYISEGTPQHYLTVLEGQRQGRLALLFMADSQSRIQELVRAGLQLRVQPDWGSPEEVIAPTQPGSAPSRVRISQMTSQSLLQRKVQPKYPKEARKAHIQGSVVMLGHISTQGQIENLYVLSGPPVLARAAIDAVSHWQYRPYVLQGKPIEVETQITVAFVLN